MEAPPAARATAPGWRDPRLWIGVALVAGSIVVGAKVVSDAGDMTQVWAARSDLAAGQAVERADLVSVRVHLDAAQEETYLAVAGGLPEATVLARAVGEGELLPALAFADDGSDLVEVPVWAPADAIPTGLAVGAHVDVWVTSGDAAKPAEAVLEDVLVVALPAVDQAFGPGGNRQVLVGVSPEQRGDVGRVLAAAHDGRVALTREG